MLMKPFSRWHEQAARLPVDPCTLFSLYPHERIPFSRKNEDMRPGAMPMSSGVGTHWILFYVGTDGIGGKMKQDPPGTLPSSAVFQQMETGNVRNEIGIPCSMTLNFFSFPAEVTILAAKSI